MFRKINPLILLLLMMISCGGDTLNPNAVYLGNLQTTQDRRTEIRTATGNAVDMILPAQIFDWLAEVNVARVAPKGFQNTYRVAGTPLPKDGWQIAVWELNIEFTVGPSTLLIAFRIDGGVTQMVYLLTDAYGTSMSQEFIYVDDLNAVDLTGHVWWGTSARSYTISNASSFTTVYNECDQVPAPASGLSIASYSYEYTFVANVDQDPWYGLDYPGTGTAGPITVLRIFQGPCI